MSDITLEALDIMDDHLSLAMSEVEVSTCTSETTNPLSSFVTEDIEHKYLADNYDEQLLSNNTDEIDVNATLITDHSHLHVFSRKKVNVFSRKVLHYRRKANSSSLNLGQSESVFKDDHGESQTQLCLPEMLKITTYTKDSDAECARKEQFLNVHGTVYILDHIDSTGKRKNARRVHSNKKPPLKKNNKAKKVNKIKPNPDGQLYLTENTDLSMEESTVANGKLPSEIQLSHDTNRTLNEEFNKSGNAENKMDDINQSVNLSSVQNQIKMENIDVTSDFLHGLKQIETSSLSNGSNMQTENIHQPSDLLQGQKQTRSQILTNGNFTDFNDLENQTHTTQIKQENVQDETPALNQYQETICEYEQRTYTHNPHLDNSIIVHKDGKNVYILKRNELLTAILHDHNYYQVPEGDCETDLPIKENKLNKQFHILEGKGEGEKLKAMEEKRKLEIEASMKEQRCKEKLKEMEENRKLKIEAGRRKLKERNRILKEQTKEEKLKAIEEKRKQKKEVSRQPVPCPNCKEMISKMWEHKWVCSEEPFLCVFCGILLRTRRQLYHHEMYNHDERPKNCNICHKTFKNRRTWQYHKKQTHKYQSKKHKSKPNFLCSICGKTFSHETSLRNHTETHSDEGPYKCRKCDAVFKLRGFYKRHMGFCHVSGKIFSCTESGCDRQFQRKESWQKHIKWHQICRTDMNEGPFKCSYCDAEFRLRSYLKKHMKWHLSQNNFSCTESGCERMYHSNRSLQNHKKWHQTCKAEKGGHQNCKADKDRHQNCKADKDEGLFQCKDCDAEFQSRKGLQHHIGFCHSSGKLYSCTESGCERKYTYKYGLRRHERWHEKCKTAIGPLHTTRVWSGEENNILRVVFKEEISGKKEFDIEKMRRFIKKYPWVLKDVQTKNDLRLKRIRTKLYNERFLNKQSANNHGKTNTPSEPSDGNSSETETPLVSEPSDSNSRKTEAHLDPELPDSNSSDTEAYSPSELSENNSGETEALTL